MSGRDEDLDLLLDGLAQVERDAYQKGLGEHLAAMIDAPSRQKEEQTNAFMDLMARSRAETDRGHGDDAA